jgi:hypothetical protein
MKSYILASAIVLASVACAVPDDGRRLWANKEIFKADDIKPLDDKWAGVDKDEVDKQLAQAVADGGDFYASWTRPTRGFLSPLGEQAACVIDKSAHILEFHFCTSIMESRYQYSIENNCEGAGADYLDTTLKALSECCEGDEHIPTWSEMQICSNSIDPLVKEFDGKVQTWKKCVKSADEALDAAAKIKDDDEMHAAHKEAYDSDECREAGEMVTDLVEKLHDIGGTMFVESHALDITENVKRFMYACAQHKKGEHWINPEHMSHKGHTVEHKHVHRRLDEHEAPTNDPFKDDILETFGGKCYYMIKHMWELEDQSMEWKFEHDD